MRAQAQLAAAGEFGTPDPRWGCWQGGVGSWRGMSLVVLGGAELRDERPLAVADEHGALAGGLAGDHVAGLA